MTPIPPVVLKRASSDLARMASDWHGEIPMRLHSANTDHGGYPEWSSAFLSWISANGGRRMPEDRLPVKRAMKNLRLVAPREYDCVLRAIMGDSIEGIRDWLNDRATTNGYPERYTLKDATFLVISGVDKVSSWIYPRAY